MLSDIVGLPRFWQAWDAFQASTWLLRGRRRLCGGELETETRRAEAILHTLRGIQAVLRPLRLGRG